MNGGIIWNLILKNNHIFITLSMILVMLPTLSAPTKVKETNYQLNIRVYYNSNGKNWDWSFGYKIMDVQESEYLHLLHDFEFEPLHVYSEDSHR